MPDDPLSGENLYYDVIAYTRFGEHRAGTDCDALTSQWILNRLKDAGLDASFQTYTFRQYLPTRFGLAVNGVELKVFPEWTPRFSAKPINAPLTGDSRPEAVQGKVVLLSFPEERREAATFRANLKTCIRELAEAGALAVVLVTPGPSGEVFIFGDEEYGEPFALPLLAVGSREQKTLTQAAESGTPVSFVLEGEERKNATSRNVLARWGNGKDIIVVSTPISGWFTCGGERGPGIAIALGLARWVGVRQPEANYLFDFNSGHELTGIGARRFLASQAPKPPDVRCWLHLGANIATYDWEREASGYKPRPNPVKYQVQSSDAALLPVVKQAFSTMPLIEPYVGPGIGELTAFIQEGYRAFGMFGGRHYYFHNPGDGPQTTSPELLEPVARCLAKALEAIEMEKR
jgi:hypothetical protein